MNSIRRVVIQRRVHGWHAAAAAASVGSACYLWNDTRNNKSSSNSPEPNPVLLAFLRSRAACEATSSVIDPPAEHIPEDRVKAGMTGGGDELGLFHGLFPLRQLWKPAKPYPLWDDDWDDRQPPSTGNEEVDRERDRAIRHHGVTRHIILIRHGQYDETHREDHRRTLTELGKKQAHLTGQRLVALLKGVDDPKFTPIRVVAMHVSDLTRAKETAAIIESYMPEEIRLSPPDANLNEGRPAHNIPGGQARPSVVAKTDECHSRIETAFQRYFYRSDKQLVVPHEADNPQESSSPPPQELHEFEIIVGHANVIRYFVCRALQLPPEAWLRLCIFNCSLTYLTIRPTGTVSCRMIGDIGHLPYDHETFSMHYGFNW